MKTHVCSYCSHEQERSLKFCTKCGKLIVHEKIPRKPLITKERLPLIGSVGVVGIAISLLSLLDFDDIPISPNAIYITGIILFVLGIGGTYLLKRRESIKDSSLILLLLTYEVIFLSTQFLYDMMLRSEYSRYSLLISSLLVLFISASTNPYFEKSTFQSIHLIFGVYFGWAIIFLVSGSIISPVIFTAVTILAIIITNYYSIRYPDVVISSAYFIIEAIIMINAIFINFSYFFFVALTIFIVNPLLLYKFKNREITKFLIYISLIPTVSILYGISSSSLINPLPQILFVVFSLSWAWYLSKSDLPSKVVSNVSVWLSGILMFGVFIYALSYSGFEVLLTYLGMTLVISILVFNIDRATRRKIQLANIILMFLVELILYPSYFSLGGLVIFFLVNIPIIFLQDIRLKEFSGNILLLGQIMITTFFVIIYSIPLRTDDSVYYLLYFANIVSIGLIYLIHLKMNYNWRYLSLIANFAISTIGLLLLVDITGFLISSLVISILIVSLVFMDKGLMKSDLSILGWLLILGIQVIIVSLSENLFVTDLAVFFTLAMGLFSYFVQSDKLTKYYMPLIISSVGIITRSLTHFETEIISDSSMWALLLVAQFIIFTVVIIVFPMLTKLIDRKDDQNKIFSLVHLHHLVYLLVWVLLGKLIHGMSIEIADEVLGELVIWTLQVGILLILALLIINKLGSYQPTEKFSIIPVSLLLNLIIYLYDPSYYNEILSYIYILIVSFYSIKLIIDSDAHQVWLIIWFVLLSINLMIIAGFGELSTFIAVFAGYAILQAINVIYSQKVDIPRYYVTLAFNVVFIVVGIISRVLPLDDTHSMLNSFIFWVVIIVTTHVVQIIRSDAMKEELIFISILTIFSTMLWIGIDTPWLSSLMIGIGIISIALSYKILFRDIEKDHLPKVTFETMSILLAFAGIILTIVQLLLYNQVIEVLLLNRIIFWSSLGLFLILAATRKFVNRLTVILDVMIILSFLLVISTNLLAYFDSVVSNIVFLVLAMSFSIGGLLFKDYGTFYIGVGLSILSALKALIDLAVIEGSEKWFSVLIASVQLIWYTIVYSGPIERIDKEQENGK